MMNSKSKISNKHATYLLTEWNEEARGVTTSRSKHNEEAKRRKEVNRQKGVRRQFFMETAESTHERRNSDEEEDNVKKRAHRGNSYIFKCMFQPRFFSKKTDVN